MATRYNTAEIQPTPSSCMHLQFLPLSTPAGAQEVMGFTLPKLQQHVLFIWKRNTMINWLKSWDTLVTLSDHHMISEEWRAKEHLTLNMLLKWKEIFSCTTMYIIWFLIHTLHNKILSRLANHNNNTHLGLSLIYLTNIFRINWSIFSLYFMSNENENAW